MDDITELPGRTAEDEFCEATANESAANEAEDSEAAADELSALEPELEADSVFTVCTLFPHPDSRNKKADITANAVLPFLNIMILPILFISPGSDNSSGLVMLNARYKFDVVKR